MSLTLFKNQITFWFFLIIWLLCTDFSAAQNLNSSNTQSESILSWGSDISINSWSNVYSISDVLNNHLSNPDAKSNKLFASGVGRANLYVSLKECSFGFEKTYMAAAKSNSDTLSIYNNINSQGFSPVLGSQYFPIISSTALTGFGAAIGCFATDKSGISLGGSIHANSLNKFTQHSYQGAVSAGPNGASVILNENWIAMTSQLPELQTNNSVGQYYSFDLDLGYQKNDVPFFGNLIIYNLLSSIYLDNISYLIRNLNATFPKGGIIQNGTIPPLTGNYGNQDIALKIPKIWSSDFGYHFNKNIDLGVKLNGVDQYYQTLYFTTFRCPTCQISNGFTAVIDTNASTIGLGYTGSQWSIYIGTLLNHSTGINSINQMNLTTRF